MPRRMQKQRLLFPTLQGYRVAWLRNDLVAGVAAGAVVIPQAMAYATIADLPVEVGLYTCILPLLVYAALGGSRALSASTTSTIATLTATTMVSAGVVTTSAAAAGELATLTLMVGLILVLARVAKLGSIVENINQATMVGIKVGLGLTVALGQVPKLLGVEVTPTGHGFIRTVAATIEAIPSANLPTLVLSLGSILVLVVLRRLAPLVPGQLVVVVAGILLAATTGLADAGVDLVGPVPGGLPAPTLPALDRVGQLVPGALAIAVMAFLETAAVARGIRRTDEPSIDSNTELLAAGSASLVGSFFGTLPAAGGFSQSAVNQRAGARTQLASVVTASLAVLVAVFLSPVLANLPQAVLASMVIVAVVGLVDIPGVVRFWRASRTEFWICITTAAIGLAAGLLPAVAAGVLFTIGLVLHHLNQPHFTSAETGPVLVVRLQLSLYTASVEATNRAILDLVDDSPDVTTVELDATAMTATSFTVLDALADLDRELAASGIRLRVIGLSGQPLALARTTDWWRTVEGRSGSPATDEAAPRDEPKTGSTETPR